jgi:hypothetical protein
VLYAPDAGLKGLDPIVLLDAILGRPDNLGPWEDDLLAYSASTAPQPRNKREKPSLSPSDLAQRLTPRTALRARSLLRQSFGEVADAADVLDRLAEMLRELDEPDDETASADTADEPTRRGTRSRATPPRP